VGIQADKVSMAYDREVIVDRLSKLKCDKAELYRYLFPDMFRIPFSDIHADMFSLLKKPGKKKILLAPRGIGKTSFAKALCMEAILFAEKKFIVYIGSSTTLAEMQTENIKHMLLGSKELKDMFGDVRIDTGEATGIDSEFSRRAWVAFGRTMILPRGCGQRVRGINWRNRRPDLIIFDDIEDRKLIRSEDNRAENLKWLHGDVLQSVSYADNNFDIVYIDTLKHQDALVVGLMEMLGWASIKLEICGDDYKSKAPSFMSDDQIQELVESYQEAGQLDVFFQEFRNIPISPVTASFKREYFKYFGEDDIKNPFLETVILVDPARSVTPQAAESAIVGVSVDIQANKIFVRDVVAGKMYPDDMYDEIFSMALRLNAHVIGIEVTGLSEFITYPFKNEIVRRGASVELVELNARGKKEERIAALIPLYRRGLIYHEKASTHQLEQQLLSFPLSKRFDIMDALAYVVEMFDVGGRFFTSPYSDMLEDEVLENEDPVAIEDMIV